jgi:hypothetical protein
MQKLKTGILIGMVILEAIVIILLITTQKRLVVVRPGPVSSPYNPLKMALEYQSPDQKFKELVLKYPYLISARTSIKGVANSPILADCAILERTNYVRILIENGADVEDAVKSLEEVEAKDAISLLRQVQFESKSKIAQ